jgi:hypothetical protein
MTGLLRAPIDIPSFSWELSVGDSALATTKDKGTGEGEASSVTVPWTAVAADDAMERQSVLSTGRRALCLFWWTEEDGDRLGVPVLFGAIGKRSDTALDTSFDLDSPMSLMGGRIAVPEGVYGRGSGGTTRGDLSYSGRSLRAIASALGQVACAKPGGSLPIDWQYAGEAGPNERTYHSYACTNNSVSDLFENIANVEGGPDVTFRPYLADGQHVRVSLLAGSNASPYLGQGTVHRLTWPGTVSDIRVDSLPPVSRVYAYGAGSEDEQLGYLAEDLTLQELRDPYPLVEEAVGFTDDENLPLLRSHANARLAADGRPRMQITAEVNVASVPVMGSMWPGETVELAIDGFPTLPDGVYGQRLMSMRGDEGPTVTLKFAPFASDLY